MIITPAPIIIPQRPSKSPEEEANAEAIKRYDDASRREAFCAGARWERGDDEGGATPPAWAIVAVLWLFINVVVFFMPGVMEGCHRDLLLAPCGYTTKWTYVFPGARLGQYFGDWMAK